MARRTKPVKTRSGKADKRAEPEQAKSIKSAIAEVDV